ncbi:MAG: c-type cytochrome domain-containing protein [Planctomycetota bacterium]
MNRLLRRVLLVSLVLIGTAISAAEVPDFNGQVLPVFRKYCNGCHNTKEAEGGLVLEDYARAMKGGENGAAIVAGKSGASRLWKQVSGQDEPKMPPETAAQPKPAELAVIKAWIDAGAKAPTGGLAATGLVTPKIEAQGKVREPITSVAASPNGKWLAVARPHAVEVLNAADRAIAKTLTGHTGAINDVSFSANGEWLCVASGETGLVGEATLWKTTDWTRGRVVQGHRDSIYAAQLSPDATMLATASYDRDAMTWDVASGQLLKTFSGHNDAVYGLAFAPNGKLLATASGDRTVKLWDVATGQRLDTFSQPSKDQSTVAFSPNGRFVAAGGVDFRVRIWQVSESAREGTNPILYARFAHEGPILKVAFSPDGRLLASSSEDRRIKLWETKTFTQVAVLERQQDWAAAIAFTSDSRQLLAGRMSGALTVYPLDPKWGDSAVELEPLSETVASTNEHAGEKSASQSEVEPNDEPSTATPLALPGIVKGEFKRPANDKSSDPDFYRIAAKSGQVWIIETNAGRSGSLADTKVEVLHADGQPVLRALLQAVRDSWINFRPIDSSSADVRLEFWEEMDLNQFVYMQGEVCKTFRSPQGPDSGYQLYALGGKRRDYFDTSATAHAKEEPCYIVEAYPPGSKIVDNGLPVFPLYFSNDDDAERKLDKDSRLTFTVPADGAYLVRVNDVRGFTGDKQHYTLTVRPPMPDFGVTINTMAPKVPAGSGQRLKFTLSRIDNFEGDVRIDIAGLPAGFSASSPVVIAAGHVETNSVLTAAKDAPEPKKEDWERVAILATGLIDGRLVTKTIGSLGEIKLEKPSQIRVIMLPDNPKYTAADGGLIIEPGTTITAKIVVERNGFDGDVKFDVDNLPHGVIVDNIGLSGVLVRAKETERQIFLTARPWVSATSRWIHAVAQVQGNQASSEVRLHVSGPGAVAAK